MGSVSMKRTALFSALLLGAVAVASNRVESAEPHHQLQAQEYGAFNLSDSNDVPYYRVPCEPGDIPLAPWDRAGRVSGLCNRWHVRHEEKKAWHYYIRGVGPAVHERSPGRPCLW